MIFFRFLTYNKFRARNWPHLAQNDRLEAYQKLENIQAEKQHRPPCEIVAIPMEDGTHGKFSQLENIIYLNENCIMDPHLVYHGMFTIFHEGRHAYQHYICFRKEKLHKWSTAYRWRKNILGYEKGTEDTFSFYSMQPIERDANRYALNRLKQFHRRYQYDPLYEATVKLCERIFVEEKLKAKKDLGLFHRWKVNKNIEKNIEDRSDIFLDD
ncbi:MAG: hypothetical protein IKQ31_00720 [Clostridia bacterium]|nr:hypothetical protein [Clostridia bacterium]